MEASKGESTPKAKSVSICVKVRFSRDQYSLTDLLTVLHTRSNWNFASACTNGRMEGDISNDRLAKCLYGGQDHFSPQNFRTKQSRTQEFRLFAVLSGSKRWEIEGEFTSDPVGDGLEVV